MINRRHLIAGGAVLAGTAMLPARLLAAEIDTSDLVPMTGHARPIDRAERLARIERAQRLMHANKIDAILIEPGSSMVYFSGIEWWRSERLTAFVLPARGAPLVVTPFFEEPSVRESLVVPADVRVWQEDESPTALIAGALRERGLASGTIGIEETVRFFGSDGLAQHLPHARLVSANPVVRGCRLIKTPAEIALLQIANDVTLAAMKWTWGRVKEGMTRDQVAALVTAATGKLGGSDVDALILLGEAAAYPHGSHKPQTVREGEVVLMDCGCKVHGYTSDISRTFVPGRAPDDVRRVFDQVAEGQHVAVRSAKVGLPAGAVDDAVRAYYTRLGYGPGYRLPGLSHRTGHGIGMDGHEPVNLVHGETTALAPGMCFSDEPGLYLPEKFGVRLEDCWRMTEAGPKFFTAPPMAIDQPFG
ncbi:M24 family metallopeptidase [Sphingomonas sp. MMS24-J13]|uniref:M24 family metallopeptidase n=1 Tax=Sphingomonas sp. MMS24-J13 TaxID=3238686 RepID=UPI00384B1BF9